MKAAITSALVALLACSVAHAKDSPLAKTAREGDLLGIWRRDCAKPTSRENWGMVYTATVGGVQMIDDGGPDTNFRPSEVTSIKRAAAGRLAVVRIDEDGKPMHVLIETHGGRLRVLQSSGFEDGKPATYIKDGRFTEDGTETPWFNRCGPG